MCARYWTGIELHGFENKLSTVNKEANWKLLRKYFAKNKFDVDESLIQGVIHCTDGCAEQMLFSLYTALTKREIQLLPPSVEVEVDNIPVFVKQPTQTSSSSANRNSTQVDAQKQAEERARLEAQRRADALRQQQAQQQQGKPRTLAKAQAIQAADNEDDEGHVQHAVQFSSVSVKPLPPQMLARLGAAAKASDQSMASEGAGAAGPSRIDGDGVLSVLSSLIAATLREADQPLWPTSAGTPTLAEYLVKNVHTMETSLRQIVWGQLSAKCESVVSVLTTKPTEFSDFVDLFAPHVVQSINVGGSSTADISSHYSAAASRYFASVVSIAASSSPAAAIFGLKHAFLPAMRRLAPFSASTADGVADMALCFIHVVKGITPPFASAFFSALFDVLCGSTDLTVGDDASKSRTDFLLVLHGVLRGFSYRKRSAIDDERASSTTILDEHCAAVAYYNAVAGLYSAVPSERITAVRLLGRLVELGGGSAVYSNGHLNDAVAAAESFTSVTSATGPRCAQWSTDQWLAFSNLVAIMQQDAASALREGRCDEELVISPLRRAALLIAQVTESFIAGQQKIICTMSRVAIVSLVVTLARCLWLFPPAASSNAPALAVAKWVLKTHQPAAIVHESRLIGLVKLPEDALLSIGCPLRLCHAIIALTNRPHASVVELATAEAKGSRATSGSSTAAKVANRMLKTGDLSDVNAPRLGAIASIFSLQSGAGLGTLTQGSLSDEDLVTLWWEVVKAVEPCISVTLFAAEVLSAQLQSAASNAKVAAQLPSESLRRDLFDAAALAQSVLIRAYIDFSGNVNPQPSSAEMYAAMRSDPSTATSAMEWFNQIVAADGGAVAA